MAKRITIPVVGGSYQHDSLPFDAQKTINLFTEMGGDGSSAPAIFRRMPGLKRFAEIGTGSGPIRGMYVTSNDRFFVVRRSRLYEVDPDGVETSLGSLETNSGNISMTDNGTQLVVADGSALWILTMATDTFAKVTDELAPGGSPVIDFIDGYVFGFERGGEIGVFKHSRLNDANSWNVLDIYTAEGSPDELVSLKACNRQLWLFGSKSFEVWYNNGGDNVTSNTWARIPSTFRNIGCGATHSVSTIRGQIFWLGASKDGENIIWGSGEGYRPVQISNKAIETTMANMETVSDATSFTFEYLGHFFYVLTFPTGDETFVYDIGEGRWIDWNYRDENTGVQGRHRAVNHVSFERKSLVGDYENGRLYELDKETYTDNLQPIVWERYFAHFHAMKKNITWYYIELDMVVGTANLSGAGSDPNVQLRWSDDGGYTFGNWHTMSLGKTGKYGTRVIERLLGTSRDRIYHIRSSEPIPISIHDDCVAEVEISDF